MCTVGRTQTIPCYLRGRSYVRAFSRSSAMHSWCARQPWLKSLAHQSFGPPCHQQPGGRPDLTFANICAIVGVATNWPAQHVPERAHLLIPQSACVPGRRPSCLIAAVALQNGRVLLLIHCTCTHAHSSSRLSPVLPAVLAKAAPAGCYPARVSVEWTQPSLHFTRPETRYRTPELNENKYRCPAYVACSPVGEIPARVSIVTP